MYALGSILYKPFIQGLVRCMPVHALGSIHKPIMQGLVTCMPVHKYLTTMIVRGLSLLSSTSFTESVMLVETPSAGVEVDAGSTVYYVCVGYDELDPPSIMWKLGETVLTNGSGSLVTVYTKLVMLNNLTFTQSILELCGVQLENNGSYSCSAIGSTNSTYNFDLKVRVSVTMINQELRKRIDVVLG